MGESRKIRRGAERKKTMLTRVKASRSKEWKEQSCSLGLLVISPDGDVKRRSKT